MEKIGRKIYHLAGGLVLIGLYARLGREAGLPLLLGVFIFATSLDIARLKVPSFNSFFFRRFPRFIRESEKDRLTGTPWYVLGILCAAAFFELSVAVYSVVFLACGDVAATSVGERWGTVKVAGGKSLQGTLAFFVSSLIAGLAVSRFYPMDLFIIILGALTASVVEVLPIRINDNLTIPVIAGGVMQVLVFAGGF